MNDAALPILYRDDWLVVVDKPAGLLVHRSPVDARETRFAVQMLRDQLGRSRLPVHRLDKGTSGALAFALDPRHGAQTCPRHSRAPRSRRSYLALVRGWPDERGEIDHALRPVEDDVLPADRAAAASRAHELRAARDLRAPVPCRPLSDQSLRARAAATAHRATPSAPTPPRAPVAPDRR